MKYHHSGDLVLAQLMSGPATTAELIERIYGVTAGASARRILNAKRALWVAVHRLRKAGYTIVQENRGTGIRHYRLEGVAPCHTCQGVGLIIAKGGGGHAER